ncbi:hypothetical protein [Nostoc sp. WHI]|uniref:hypothetical protein n=1 Tax=Nostoc sp. WHI TaxID=2650611 RepID=UPI001E590C39|nr:hypothetical protein [Nostoc sp. WHI]
MKNFDVLEICRVNLFLLFSHSGLSKVKAEVSTDCAKHRNVKAEVPTGKAEIPTDCAKHRNVKTKVPTGKAEIPTDCAKHRNVKTEVLTGKAEIPTDCAKHRNVNLEQYFLMNTNRIFLQKVGGGYIFVHRMLQEHFASME